MRGSGQSDGQREKSKSCGFHNYDHVGKQKSKSCGFHNYDHVGKQKTSIYIRQTYQHIHKYLPIEMSVKFVGDRNSRSGASKMVCSQEAVVHREKLKRSPPESMALITLGKSKCM